MFVCDTARRCCMEILRGNVISFLFMVSECVKIEISLFVYAAGVQEFVIGWL